MSTLPEGMTAEKLRKVADWLDTYDTMAAEFIAICERSGVGPPETLKGARAACAGTEVQDDLRAWADTLDDGDCPACKPEFDRLLAEEEALARGDAPACKPEARDGDADPEATRRASSRDGG